jgi:hypothetical protein
VRGQYADFGPTLAHEKLLEVHSIPVSRSAVREWMLADGVWTSRRERKQRIQQPRYRRACLGELIQIDGCLHRWFEDRGPQCTALVFIDDATGRLMELRFVRSESTFDYFESTQQYLRRHGKPVAFYSDKHASIRAQVHGGLQQALRASPSLTSVNDLIVRRVGAPTARRATAERHPRQRSSASGAPAALFNAEDYRYSGATSSSRPSERLSSATSCGDCGRWVLCSPTSSATPVNA